MSPMGLQIADFGLRINGRLQIVRIATFAVVLIATGLARVESRAPLEIRTLSSRADLVSGGDTLLAVTVPQGTRADQLTVTINGTDVTA